MGVNYKWILLIIVSSLVFTIAAYAQMSSFYFWHDDFTHLYKAQQNIQSSFPYQFFSFATPILYKYYQLNPQYYFYTGIFLYWVSALLVYILLKIVFQKNLLAYAGMMLFSSGYVGQDSIKMFIGDGIGTLPILPIVITYFITLLKVYEDRSRTYLTLCMFLLFFLILELAPHRYGGIIIPSIGLDIFFLLNEKRKNKNVKLLIVRILTFLTIFLIEYKWRPTNILWNSSQTLNDYTLHYSTIFSLANILNESANIWNFFFPSFIQATVYTYFSHTALYFKLAPALISAIPIYLLLILVGLPLTRDYISSPKLLLKGASFVVFHLVLLRISSIIADPITRVQAINGILFLTIFFYQTIKWRSRSMVISLLLISSIYGIFVREPSLVFETSYRYFMAFTFITPMIISLFINGYLKNKLLLSIMPVATLIVLHIIAGQITQYQFKNSYARDSKIIHQELTKHIPTIDHPIMVWFKGSTQQLEYTTSDAFRVGELPSQAAIAIHYQVPYSLIIWPDTYTQFIELKQKYQLPSNDVYIFEFDGKKLTRL